SARLGPRRRRPGADPGVGHPRSSHRVGPTVKRGDERGAGTDRATAPEERACQDRPEAAGCRTRLADPAPAAPPLAAPRTDPPPPRAPRGPASPRILRGDGPEGGGAPGRAAGRLAMRDRARWRRRLWATAVAALAGWSSGCATTREATPNPLIVPVGDFETVWSTTVGVLDEDFDLASANRESGELVPDPTIRA